MSAIASLSSASAALPTIKSHAHGHKKGSQVESTDDAISDATLAPVPAATQQNLFSSLLQSLQQTVGAQTATATSATATTSATAAASAPAGGATTASTPSAAAATTAGGATTAKSATAALQTYINNVSQQLQANGSQTANPAKPNLSVSA
jgi:hypothetical protein